ncbi:TPA: hypothetical protein ACPJ10_004538 [Vibrio diabolicus]
MKIEIDLPEITESDWSAHSRDIIENINNELRKITKPNEPILPIPPEELRYDLAFKLGGTISTTDDGKPVVTASGGIVITF